MKHSFLLLALSLGLMGAAQAQNANGHFSMRYSQGASQTDLVQFCRSELPNLCDGSTFEITRDNLSRQGMRSVTLQQYVNGVRANGKTINIHMRNGKITSINGNVVTRDMVAGETLHRAPRPAAQVMQLAGLPEKSAEKAELVAIVKDGVARQAYLVLVGTDRMLIDALTGEVLSKTSIFINVDDDEPEMVTGKGMTYYYGEQTIETAMMDGEYSLIDFNRQVYTLDGSYQKMMENGLMEMSMSGVHPIIAMIESSEPIINDSPDWMDTTFKTYLSSLTVEISSVDYLGKYVMGEVFFDDNTSVSTEPAMIMDMLTDLPLPYVIDHETQTIRQASAYLYDPETGEKELIGSMVAKPSPNVLIKNLNDDFAFYVNNYFEGYLPIIDIHWGMSKVIDYYRDTFGLDSFDGKGTEIFCLANPASALSSSENAAAAPMPEGFPGLMLFGLGGTVLNPVVDLVVMGHEFTHLVARNLASPLDDNEDCHAGALNESFADIMGLAIQRQATGREDWALGDNVMRYGGAIRYLDEPELNGDPSCYLDANFDVENYEEHTNAGVQNHMFYLLVTGGEGINSLGESYAVTPMDRTEAETLAFTTLTEYTFMEMNYQDAAEAWSNAAADMFGEGSAQQKSVMQAWAAVGLGNGDITSIEQLSTGTQKRGLRYNLQGQRVGNDYRGVVIEL